MNRFRNCFLRLNGDGKGYEMNLSKTVKKVYKKYGINVHASENDRSVILFGECGDWNKIVAAGKMYGAFAPFTCFQ